MTELFRQNTKFKIIIAFGILLLVMVGIQYFSSVSINHLINNEKEYHKNIMALSEGESLKASVYTMQSHLKTFYTTLDINNLEEAKEHIESIKEHSRILKESLTNTAQIESADKLVYSVNDLVDFYENISQLFSQNDSTATKRLFEKYTIEQKTVAFEILCDKIIDTQVKLIPSKMFSNEVFANRVSQMDLTGTLFTFLIILFFAWILISDINKRNQLEKDLKSAKLKADQSVIAKELFMANMSHEIRTPMTSIVGFINLLERSKLDDIQKDYLRTVKNSSENLLTIINDILDFSKLEAGMIRFEQTPFSIQGLLHSVNTMFLPKTKEKNIRLIFHPLENIPETQIGDPTRLTQILINLIGNAIKFTHEGVIEVSAKLLSEENQIDTIQFTVSDTGIGIPKEKIGIIFDRFQQADVETNRRYGGTGLGLSIVKSLVEFQGGIIGVDSEEGKGTLFSFTIPYKKGSSEQKKQISAQEKIIQKDIINKIRILVAEDNPLNRKLVKALFGEWGIDFEFAENGREAIDKIKSGNFGMVLMDIQMPEINGYDATKFIRENLKSSVPVIAMTAHALEGEREKCISMGMNDYISKPINENELYSIIVKYAGTFSRKDKVENTSVSTKTEKVTNLDFLTSLAAGKMDFFNEMIRLFLEECPKEVSRLRKAIDDRNFQMIHSNAHAMKSTIPFVGLDTKLKPLLEEIEYSSDHDKIVQLFTIIETVCSKAIEELKNNPA